MFNLETLSQLKHKATDRGVGKETFCPSSELSWCRVVLANIKITCNLYSLRALLVAQTVKNPPAVQETQVPSLGKEGPLKEEMVTHSSILAWRVPWVEEPGGLQSMGLPRMGHNWGTKHIGTHSLEEGRWETERSVAAESVRLSLCTTRQKIPRDKEWSKASRPYIHFLFYFYFF